VRRERKFKEVFGKALNVIATILSFLMTLVGFSEFYIVGVKKEIEGYPFGSECAPNYYETPELYAKIVLISGIIYAILFLFQVYNWKKSIVNGYVVFIMTLALFLLDRFLLKLF
jgi:divalent metal cation (Fe/Co/Zn/Cd) transporter